MNKLSSTRANSSIETVAGDLMHTSRKRWTVRSRTKIKAKEATAKNVTTNEIRTYVPDNNQRTKKHSLLSLFIFLIKFSFRKITINDLLD